MPKPAAVITLGAVVLAVAATAWRLRYGISWYDEAWYVAIPYRFVLGSRPYIDEVNANQFFGILTYPLVWLWVQLTGSTDSIVLFMRFMWLAFMSGVALLAFRLQSKVVEPGLALACAAVYVVAIPFTIPGISYNTAGSGLLTAGCCLLGLGLIAKTPSFRTVLIAGLLHGLAILAYPPLAAAALVSTGLLAWIWGLRSRHLRAYALGWVAVVAIAAVLLFALVGSEKLLADLSVSRLGPFGGGVAKLRSIAETAWGVGRRSLLAGGSILAATLALWNRIPRARLLLLALPIVALVPLLSSPTTAVLLWIPLFGSLSLFVLLRLRPGEPLLRAVKVLVPTSVVGGIATAYTSTNGAMNAGFGMSPLLLIAVPLVLLAAAPREARDTAYVSTALALAAALVVGMFVATSYLDSYPSFDQVLPLQMHRSPETGPWAHVMGSPEQVDLVDSAYRDTRQYVGSGETVLYYYDFPAGILMGKSPVASPMVWVGWHPAISEDGKRAFGQLLEDYYAREDALPDVVFRTNLLGWYKAGDPMWDFTERHHYTLVAHRARYDVFVRGD